MTDIVERLRNECPCSSDIGCADALCQEAAAEITRLRAENERLRAALKECEEELDGYYHQDYPTDHPYHQRKLKVALQGNPARAALKGENT